MCDECEAWRRMFPQYIYDTTSNTFKHSIPVEVDIKTLKKGDLIQGKGYLSGTLYKGTVVTNKAQKLSGLIAIVRPAENDYTILYVDPSSVKLFKSI